jgi:hypothetical protein
MSRIGAAPRAAVPISNARAEASRQKRRQIARAEHRSRQVQIGAECAQARHARPELRGAARRERRRVPHARGGAGRTPASAWPCLAAGLGNGAPTPFRWPSDGNGTRSFETLSRYRSAAMAKFWHAQDAQGAPARAGRRHWPHLRAPDPAGTARPPLAQRPQPNEPETSRAQHAAPASGTSPKPYRTRPNPVIAMRLPAYRKAERTRAGRDPGRAMRGTASDVDGKLDPSMVVNREVL